MKLNSKITYFTALILSFLLTLTNLHAKTFKYKGLTVGIPESPHYVYWGINGTDQDFSKEFQEIFTKKAWSQEADPFKWYLIFDQAGLTEVILPLSGDLKTIHNLVDVSSNKSLTVSWIAIDQTITTFTCYYFKGGFGVTHLKNQGGEIIGVVRNSTSENKSSWLSEGVHTLTEKGIEVEKGIPGRWSRSRKSFMPYAFHIDHYLGDKNDTGDYTHQGNIGGVRSKTGNSFGCNRHNGEVSKRIYDLKEGTTFTVVYR